MPPLKLTDIEARILGCLIEKSLTTPLQYPLTLNSLVLAANQISNRDPVMNLDETTVARTLAGLQEKNLVGRRNEPGSRVTKFMHHVETLLNGGTAQEIGAICVLLLRGAQTAGEIKTRTERLCEFASPAEVDAVLQDLSARSDGPFVTRLERRAGQKETRFMHLFFGIPREMSQAASTPRAATSPKATLAVPDRIGTLEKRVELLETQVKELLMKLSSAK